VFKGSTEVASGSLGSDKPLFLPEGDYRVELDSSPPKNVQVSLASRDRLTLTLEKQGDYVTHFERRDRMQYRSCEDIVASIERLEAGQEIDESVQSAIYE
jgi:hypothetical protein